MHNSLNTVIKCFVHIPYIGLTDHVWNAQGPLLSTNHIAVFYTVKNTQNKAINTI